MKMYLVTAAMLCKRMRLRVKNTRFGKIPTNNFVKQNNKYMKKMKKNDIILHGECMITMDSVPSTARKLESTASFMIVAPSETTGNHHVVDLFSGVDFYEDEDKTLYMKNTVDTNIRCMVESRHDAVTLSPGTYRFGSQMEYDPFAARLQKVRD